MILEYCHIRTERQQAKSTIPRSLTSLASYTYDPSQQVTYTYRLGVRRRASHIRVASWEHHSRISRIQWKKQFSSIKHEKRSIQSGWLRPKAVYDYAAFGEAYAPGTAVSVEQRYTYTGRELNPSGSIFYRYRTYFAGVGRFGGRDPLGYEMKTLAVINAKLHTSLLAIDQKIILRINRANITGMTDKANELNVRFWAYREKTIVSQIMYHLWGDGNLYVYCKNNPTKFTDPSGKIWCCLEWTPTWKLLGYSSPAACWVATMKEMFGFTEGVIGTTAIGGLSLYATLTGLGAAASGGVGFIGMGLVTLIGAGEAADVCNTEHCTCQQSFSPMVRLS